MARQKKPVHRVQMTDGKRNIIRQLLEEYDIETAEDIQDALKDLLGGTIKEMMEAEMDDHLGYEKSERSDNDDYRNGYKHKQVNSRYGSMEIEVPQDRKSTFVSIPGEIAHANISSDMDSLNKLVYLRRLLEIENASGLAWQLLSNIFHKREKPEYHFSNGTPNRLMTPEEIQDATNEIRTNYISDFDYDTEYQKTQDITVLKELYQNSGSNYEKLQIYRIMFNENSSNSVIKKFVNEAFHIENDYLFQLNPCEYDTVPQYIIDECDKDVLENCPQG